jgi:hypothetical protein
MAYVISNLRLGDSRFVALSRGAIDRLLAALVAAGETRAAARWERELVAWLAARRDALRVGARAGLDLSEIAWTPERFPEQRAFLLGLVDDLLDQRTPEPGADPEADPEIDDALREVHDLVADYPREIVVVGRRWSWDGRPPALR